MGGQDVDGCGAGHLITASRWAVCGVVGRDAAGLPPASGPGGPKGLGWWERTGCQVGWAAGAMRWQLWARPASQVGSQVQIQLLSNRESRSSLLLVGRPGGPR